MDRLDVLLILLWLAAVAPGAWVVATADLAHLAWAVFYPMP